MVQGAGITFGDMLATGHLFTTAADTQRHAYSPIR